VERALNEVDLFLMAGKTEGTYIPRMGWISYDLPMAFHVTPLPPLGPYVAMVAIVPMVFTDAFDPLVTIPALPVVHPGPVRVLSAGKRQEQYGPCDPEKYDLRAHLLHGRSSSMRNVWKLEQKSS
jgi:hypothetical protein